MSPASSPRPARNTPVIIVARQGLFQGADIKRLLAELSLRNPWKEPGDPSELWTA